MNRQTLKQLVLASYKDGEMDATQVNRIADLLTKQELKLYIRALKNWERENRIILEIPQENPEYYETLHDIFPENKIVVNVDPSLLLGMRLQHSDDIYEMSLRNTLDKITEHIEEQYD